MTEDVIAEINERKRREANVILLGITESNKATGQERLEDDRAALSTILPPDLSAKIPNYKMRRLGRPNAGRNRPLLIETTSVGEARTILKTKVPDNSRIAFKSYLTPSQLSHLKNLRSKLDSLVEDGTSNKTICRRRWTTKYISTRLCGRTL